MIGLRTEWNIVILKNCNLEFKYVFYYFIEQVDNIYLFFMQYILNSVKIYNAQRISFVRKYIAILLTSLQV